jgi:hypothetical protein
MLPILLKLRYNNFNINASLDKWTEV